jgi:hypothetical protein
MGGDPSKTLSQKLDQGSGVICPPDVDPAIKAPTPDAGNPAAGQSRRRSESAAEMRAPAKRGARAKIR